MPDEFKLHADTTRALRAKELLESELLVECFAVLKEGYFNQLMATHAMQTDVREKCYLALRVVDVVKGHLRTVFDQGKLAQSDLNDLAKLTERKKRFGLV